jgi:hypothetical protein
MVTGVWDSAPVGVQRQSPWRGSGAEFPEAERFHHFEVIIRTYPA